jgi:hypothetical protein
MVGARIEMALKAQATEPPSAQPAAPPPTGAAGSRLNVSVVFTSVRPTLAALQRAGVLAGKLGAHITIVVPQVVPYPLPAASSSVLQDWNERRFRVIASQSPVETTVHIYLCRDRLEALVAVLPPYSLVVMGCRKRWWPTAEWKIARHLRGAGHEVILEETE